VIWPENAVTGDKASRWAVDRLANTIGIPVLTGMIEGNADGTLRNSIRLFPETNGSQSYAKRQIVPFGEFFPLREFLDPIFEDYGVTYPNFASGTQPGVFRVPEFSVGTAICYESAFPYVARDTVRAGADILASLTSDQTFEGTVQLEQHLDQDKVRAVETGRWLVRVASTGITAIIGPDGRETQSGYAERPGPVRLPLGKPGVLYATVDPPVSNPKGAAAVRVGDTVAWMCGIGSLLSIAFACRGGRSGLGLKRAAKENP